MSTLIRNAEIIPMTERDLHFCGDILIENGRIAAIGTIDGDADEVIDGSKMIALPSFVNAHTHSPMVLMRNYKDTCEELMSWLSEIFPIEDKLQDEDIYWGSKLAIAEMIQSGCTTFADMYFQSWNTARAVRETGVRAVLGLTLFGDGEETKRRFGEFVPRIEEAMDGSDMIRLDAAPHAIYTCTADTYRLAVEWTKERGHYLSTHLSETMTEVNDSLKNNGMRPAEYLDSLGVFSVPCYLAHCVHLSDSEAGMLASHERISIVHNPASNMKLASGIAPVRKYREMGLNVSLGTDGASSNNNLSMMKEINLAAMLSIVSNMTPSAARPYDILSMATINGARALGLDSRIGTIEEGKDADIVLINTDDVNMTPLNDPLSAVVFAADRKSIDTVFCKGKKLLEHGELKTIDKDEAIANTYRCWDSILRR